MARGTPYDRRTRITPFRAPTLLQCILERRCGRTLQSLVPNRKRLAPQDPLPHVAGGGDAFRECRERGYQDCSNVRAFFVVARGNIEGATPVLEVEKCGLPGDPRIPRWRQRAELSGETATVPRKRRTPSWLNPLSNRSASAAHAWPSYDERVRRPCEK